MSLALSVATRSGLSVGAVATLAQRAEQAGLDAFYLAESASDAVVFAQAALGATTHMQVGTEVTNARLRHPAAAAMAASELDEWSGGRFRMGLGVSNPRFNEAALGMSPVSPVDFMRDYVRTMRRLLEPAGEEAAGPALDRPPARRVPLGLAALQPRMLRLAGEVADSVILSLTTPSSLDSVLDQIRAGAHRRVDGRTPRVECVIPTCLDVDHDMARHAGRGVVIGYARHPSATRLFAERGFAEELSQVVSALDAGDTEAAHAVVSAEMVDDFVLLGDLDRCADRVRHYLQSGVDRVVLFPLPPDGDWHRALTDVVDAAPHLAQRVGPVAPTCS